MESVGLPGKAEGRTIERAEIRSKEVDLSSFWFLRRRFPRRKGGDGMEIFVNICKDVFVNVDI